jgi:aspartate ammonia-lyase
MTAVITRTEHNLLGNREVPADACYGVHATRAAFQSKAEEFGDILKIGLKIGRTQGQRTRSGRA